MTGHPTIGLSLVALAAVALVAAALAVYVINRSIRARERASAARSERHRLAEANRELERLLDQRIRELDRRTAELRSVSESVAHDLRNPLNTVGLNVHLLQAALTDGDGDLGRMALEHVEHAQRQMTGVLDRLRRFSHASFTELRRETVDMTALVREVFEELEGAEPSSGVRLHLADLPPCQADPRLVRILLLNLMDNALKYSRSQDVRWVEVGFEAGLQPGAYYVRDNGDGLDPARAEELFEPFRRSGAEDDGRTVGLAVAARVVDRHGGRIWVTSRPGRGATIHFRLPEEHTG